ncbi:peptidylprolyl isomerase domain and WD repeat-containing protein 1 [Plakobranchus ocellatus]|uniref:peptidylprolyl isomerase n=1 Tax=Plakobranchus ocellatus TaxID=259542 RepID=A0AAV4A913_9GAST|nr:peptidylprolyl isomerase domain and WD repeat-containing protein 1 [Plakobranchus ocellatus]
MADNTNKKREINDEGSNDDSEDEWVGPTPGEAVQPKKRKTLAFEQVYLESIPSAEYYEKSYMHRDVITHIVVSKTGFIITASCDGHVKFWKKCEEAGIEFVKHFRSHLGTIEDLAISPNGELCASVSSDKNAKVFDVLNFDMINMLKLGFHPSCAGWLFRPGDPIATLAVAEKETTHIHIFDGRGTSTPLKTLEKIHVAPVALMKYNAQLELVVSADKKGMIEFWTGPKQDYTFPRCLKWEFKTDTDLYDFAKCKCEVLSLTFSPNGQLMATIASDRKIRIFKVLTGKMWKVLDESIEQFTNLQQIKQQIPNMEFSRRLASEKDLERSPSFHLANLVFDESGYFLMYATMLGIKVINLHTNACVRWIGKSENIRFLHLALFQGAGKAQQPLDAEMAASDNPILKNIFVDPIIVCTAFKKARFYMFSRREPDDSRSVDNERDVFNEKPSKEEIIAATQESAYLRVTDNCIIHTTMGDISCKIFAKECPKTAENFCVHSRNGYYNNHLFHRVIKGFMIQTGDPLGNGTGGESIWGGEFEDEFHPNLRHDRPYTLSMANAGPSTNGSQFFITVVPTPWLDNKHTVFGRVVKGMEVVQAISNVKVNAKTDKPYDDIRILSITLK